MGLKEKLIRLAYTKPEIRQHIVPLLRKSASKGPYWHATSLERAEKIVRSSVLRDMKGGVFAIPKGKMGLWEFMENMAGWFRGRGYYPDEIAVIEFKTDQPYDSSKGFMLKWNGDVELIRPEIIRTEPEFDLRPF